ncbi:AarF/ABC1/UbiB kinase family protein [Anabaena cylindrica FACHB-243]|nr:MULTISPECIES: AarF/ABC1/UbiB kinase family protein [Anabaena]MBD2421227.1 AarF/ABC1/UbiB kinase family protein [Anabaena cylindrica FACHB-243]MBY5284996.1 AarF/ABC1/UbiB kinase family protein [Anabaena sp. CCAP 1446/1C]MBY5311261.1 AarF/ABC1/UbiB kinase family protein [Anabaena sp. CCAP 1446/1C]MCM2408934.1 AarF/ABC1/UbiB kinase family protein [Anabaena sp. CCAP 1446/1C]
MMVKTFPPSFQSTPEDNHGGNLSVVEVVPANGTTALVLHSPRLSTEQEQSVPARAESETLGYDPEEIRAHYANKPMQVLRRILAVLRPTLSYVLGMWSDKQRGIVVKNDRRRAIQLRELLTKLGPAYIKIGQALSTRPDLVPPVYLEELTKLQDQLPPFANEIAYQFIEEELGSPPEEIYAEISAEPIAAASLGQVYKGKLKTGEEVAIKVQRPDLRERITIDLYILRYLAGWVQRKVKRVRSDLVGILDELGDRIFEEMDYIHEGENAERFFELYGHMQDVYVPKIYWEYTNRRVLTMEWINGIKLTQAQELQDLGINARYLIEVGVQCSLRQLLEHGFFHADPHPGNLLATFDGKLAYLDFGMMSEIKPPQRYGLIEAIVHVVNRDFDSLAKDYVKLEFLTPETDLTPIIPAFSRVFANAQGASVAELNIKSITDDLSALMYEYPFRVPPYYALIIRSLVTLEGIAIYIDPDFKVLSEAYPYVSKRLLTDPADELRTSLKELLFKDGKFRWNRLENLLTNARNSQDYDLSLVLNQGVEFLSSERGEFIRDRLVDEFVNGIDAVSKNVLHNFTYLLRERVGLTTVNETPGATVEQQQNLEHIKRILGILRETKGFDVAQIAPQLAQILVNPKVHHLGQQIASRFTQKALTKLIRQLLAAE